jgi:hypothetical protein
VSDGACATTGEKARAEIYQQNLFRALDRSDAIPRYDDCRAAMERRCSKEFFGGERQTITKVENKSVWFSQLQTPQQGYAPGDRL